MTKYTDEQLEAINKEGTNIIVSAGAGSGKTAVLTERVIRKLKDGVNVNELLILTFTNAAAREMKERIRKAIIKNNMLEQLSLLDSSYITTFDSFALSVVKKYHYLLNVSKNIKIVDNSIITLKKKKILNSIFDEYYISKNESFNKLIMDLCFKSDDELQKNILKLNNQLDLKVEKQHYLKNYIDNYYSDIEWIIDDYIGLLKEKINIINYNLDNLKTNNDYYYKTSEILDPLLNSSTYDEIKTNLDISLPRIKNNTDEEKKFKDNINNLIKELKELTVFDLQELKDEILMTKDNVKTIIDIILILDKEINKFKNKHDTYEFNDIAKMAIKVVKENEEVRKELKNSFNEIMIDEYQDTSDLQETFINLIENNNVYMVGDIKQSIYRFRNANPSIFKNKYNDYSNHINGYKIDLTKNFRSRKEVLEDINKIFNQVMELDVGGADYKSTHQMVFGNTNYIDNNSYLDIYNYNLSSNYTKEEAEIFIVAKDIKEKIDNHYQVMDKDTNKLRDITYNDFCIIMDRNTEFDKYKQIFEYLNIPLVMYKDETLNSGIDIILIRNILNLILKIYNYELDKEFKYYYTSIARSYLMSMDDQTIYEIVTNNSYKDTDLYKKCYKISKQLNDTDSYNLLNLVIDEFDIINKTITVGNINEVILRIDYLKDVSKNLIDIGYNVFDFIEYLNNLDDVDIKYSLNTESGDNVKIMNIHKSKGLEFPVCYFTGMHKKFNIADLKDLILYDNKYGIIIPYKNKYIKDTILKSLLKNQYIKEEISEKIRLFYVALTRTREKMIIVTSLKENFVKLNSLLKLNYRSFLDILNSIYYNLNIKEIIPQIDENYKNNIKIDYIQKLNKISSKIEVNEINIDYKEIEDKHFSKVSNKIITKEEQEKLDLGTNIHYLFEVIDFKNPNLSLIDKKYHKYINNFLNSELLNDLNCNIYKEYEFMYEDNNVLYHGFIDLMLEYKNHINIIDYKLKNIDDDNYILQLQGYKTYIENKTKKKVNIYLYSIINNTFKKL